MRPGCAVCLSCSENRVGAGGRDLPCGRASRDGTLLDTRVIICPFGNELLGEF